MKRNILLVSPDFDVETFWMIDDEGACAEVLNNVAPLALATVVGMTPSEFHVDIWDEVVHGRIHPDTALARDYDLVGVTGYNGHFRRARQVAEVFRKRGVPVAVGGPGVSGMPDQYRPHFDILFIGEAERTWPRFLHDWARGEHEAEYRQIEKLDLADSPLPRWDSIARDLGRYALGGVQTTRGCPFDCEFCDVIYLYGRRARHKPVDQVLEEVAVLERLGMTHVLFCDDEFVGDPRYAKDLLRSLIPLNNSFSRPLYFVTQLTMNLSKDDTLLELMADANFAVVFIGIETPNKDSLRETGKYQNVRKDLVSDVRKILSYGIAVRAGMIIGFDHDGPDIFEIQKEFLRQSCIPSATLSMLKAIPGTRLWRRLRGEGRVLDITPVRGDPKKGDGFKPRSYTNIVPKLLSRLELMRGYRGLVEHIYSWASFRERMLGFVSAVQRRPRVREAALSGSERAGLLEMVAGDRAAEETVEAIMVHTERVAPFMLRRVRTLIQHHVKHAQNFQNVLPHIDRLVELESSGRLVLAPDRRPVPIPEAFRADYERVFPEVHRRVYLGLARRDQVPEALTDVFVDFLVRWGDGFDGLGEHHREFLRELCDRTCARFNGQNPESFTPREPEGAAIPDVRRGRLAEDVIRSVEQELLRLACVPAREPASRAQTVALPARSPEAS